MAFTNLPPNLQDIFYNITDRIAKLETGPNQPMVYAQSAQSMALTSQSVATNAQIQAINAGIQANFAASQAVIAQSQATIASSQATLAQTTANGKNVVSYGTAAPSASGTKVGDLYFQFDGSNNVIAQYTWNGSSWVSNQMTSTVIAQLDAGKITTGTLSSITISAGSGANSFYVSSSGIMSAQGAYIKGNITADSGTFNGTINATTGYFGSYAGGNYWSIGATGITGVGSATITGGLISGSSINIGSGVFQVSSAGAMTATSGTIGGWNISSTSLYTGSLGSPNQFLSSSGGGLLTGSYTIGTLGTVSDLTVGGAGTITNNFQVNTRGTVTFNSTNYNIALFGTGAGGTINGRMYQTTSVSSRRYKHNINPFVSRDYLNIINKLNPVTFNYNEDIVDNPEVTAYGLIAEDVQAIPQTEDLVILKDNEPESIAYDRIQWYVIKAIQQLSDRLTALEGK